MEAGMFAVRDERFSVGMEDFQKAIRKLLITPTKLNLHSEGMFA
jgi:ATP-dependent 26S proteasome regulatory subunit